MMTYLSEGPDMLTMETVGEYFSVGIRQVFECLVSLSR